MFIKPMCSEMTDGESGGNEYEKMEDAEVSPNDQDKTAEDVVQLILDRGRYASVLYNYIHAVLYGR